MIKLYSEFDYLCNEPFYIEDIGTVKCPTLREIRKITYKVFSVYICLLSESFDDYLKSTGIYDKYYSLTEEERKNNNFFNLLLLGNTQLFWGLLSFFFVDTVIWNKETVEFDICSGDKVIGHLNSQNFETFRESLQDILGVGQSEIKEEKFKTKLAKDMFERFKKHKQEQKKNKADKNFEIDNMIRKYCTHNKVGINIINVWDMTYYQFTSMFSEYCNARKCDFNDMMAANTFTYKKATDYKAMEYMKKLNT